MNQDFPDRRLDYAGQAPAQPPRIASRTPWIVGILGALCACGALLCCGGAVLFVSFGMSIVSSEIKEQLASHPAIDEHIGEIESFTVNYTRSSLHEDDETFIYDVQGSRGSGSVTVKHNSDENGVEVIQSAVLTLQDGRSITLEF